MRAFVVSGWVFAKVFIMKDKEVFNLIQKEKERQDNVINLIPSENYVSADVLEALGSIFTDKYAEGYSDERYYGGNKVVDKLENLTKKRALDLFGLSKNKWSVNVQALSGTPAMIATLLACAPIGGKIMAMELSAGGHLSHGYKVSLTGKLWQQIAYTVNKDTEKLDYEAIERLAKKEKPSVIIAGYSAYACKINFAKFSRIAKKVGAILLVDMSHIAGLVAGHVHASPFKFADVVVSTTHKTLRGPRGALIFSKIDKRILNKKIDKMVFPGIQGGPHLNQISAIAVALHEASKESFKVYARQVVKNAKVMADEFIKLGYRVISGGTDNHLVLVDVFDTIGIGGKEAQERLEKAGIIVNMNMIPYDTRRPNDPSGIRLGTPAETTRGLKEEDFVMIVRKLAKVLGE